MGRVARGALSERPREASATIHAKWDEHVGDVRQELVLIGMDIDEVSMRARLNACLLSKEAMSRGPSVWTTWPVHFQTDPDRTSAPCSRSSGGRISTEPKA
ncbi:MAG: GTP-binding protein [Burkholderia sp.]